MLADALGGDALEADAAGLRAVVMAADAVLLDRGELRLASVAEQPAPLLQAVTPSART